MGKPIIADSTIPYVTPYILERYQCRVCFQFEHAPCMPEHFVTEDMCHGCAEHLAEWEKAYKYLPSFDDSTIAPPSLLGKVVDTIRNLFKRGQTL